MVPLMALREGIANVLSAALKAYDVANVCVALGMDPAKEGESPWESKAVYVRSKLMNKPVEFLVDVAEKVIEQFGGAEVLEPLIGQLLVGGVQGDAKNLIFAANGPKPEIVLADAVNNQIEIVANAEFCLVYDRPLPKGGLLWTDLISWWSQFPEEAGKAEIEVERSLYRRLNASLGSKPERLLFETYFGTFRDCCRGQLPALVPQVYLHYDPYTIKQMGGQGRLKRQRMDFLMLLPNRNRVVIEIDGKQHYSHPDGQAAPNLYAEMVSEDRHLRLLGYEIYRFGGAELQGDAGQGVVKAFFDDLLHKYNMIPAR